MKPYLIKATALLGSLVLGMTLAVSPVDAAEKKKDPGKKLYMTKTCMACHGRGGKKAIMDYPNLAGQSEKYMIRQINEIISGKRKGSPDNTGHPRSQGMRGALVTPEENKPTITKDEIKLIAAYLSKEEPAKPKAPTEPIDPESAAAGEKLYKKKCKSCHGKEGKKPLKGNPIIAGQKHNYLTIQISDIKSKARSTGKTAAMFAAVKNLTDEQIKSLADYLSQIDRTAQ
ncbi:MAG: c-type cytochrome [Rhodospirillales bacterium]|nr:c-type cytochrome [Rhodospirillales bacterium]